MHNVRLFGIATMNPHNVTMNICHICFHKQYILIKIGKKEEKRRNSQCTSPKCNQPTGYYSWIVSGSYGVEQDANIHKQDSGSWDGGGTEMIWEDIDADGRRMTSMGGH
jgi:hypothetical protein